MRRTYFPIDRAVIRKALLEPAKRIYAAGRRWHRSLDPSDAEHGFVGELFTLFYEAVVEAPLIHDWRTLTDTIEWGAFARAEPRAATATLALTETLWPLREWPPLEAGWEFGDFLWLPRLARELGDLESALGLAELPWIVGTRTAFNLALDRSANHPTYLEGLEEKGVIELERRGSLFAVRHSDPAVHERIRAKLADGG